MDKLSSNVLSLEPIRVVPSSLYSLLQLYVPQYPSTNHRDNSNIWEGEMISREGIKMIVKHSLLHHRSHLLNSLSSHELRMSKQVQLLVTSRQHVAVRKLHSCKLHEHRHQQVAFNNVVFLTSIHPSDGVYEFMSPTSHLPILPKFHKNLTFSRGCCWERSCLILSTPHHIPRWIN